MDNIQCTAQFKNVQLVIKNQISPAYPTICLAIQSAIIIHVHFNPHFYSVLKKIQQNFFDQNTENHFDFWAYFIQTHYITLEGIYLCSLNLFSPHTQPIHFALMTLDKAHIWCYLLGQIQVGRGREKVRDARAGSRAKRREWKLNNESSFFPLSLNEKSTYITQNLIYKALFNQHTVIFF